jgi:hypothetical protein
MSLASGSAISFGAFATSGFGIDTAATSTIFAEPTTDIFFTSTTAPLITAPPTLFTPAPSCLTSAFTYDSSSIGLPVYDGTVTESITVGCPNYYSIFEYVDATTLPAACCGPFQTVSAGYSGFDDYENSYLVGVGQICPVGYVYEDAIISGSSTTATCCPSGFTDIYGEGLCTQTSTGYAAFATVEPTGADVVTVSAVYAFAMIAIWDSSVASALGTAINLRTISSTPYSSSYSSSAYGPDTGSGDPPWNVIGGVVGGVLGFVLLTWIVMGIILLVWARKRHRVEDRELQEKYGTHTSQSNILIPTEQSLQAPATMSRAVGSRSAQPAAPVQQHPTSLTPGSAAAASASGTVRDSAEGDHENAHYASQDGSEDLYSAPASSGGNGKSKGKNPVGAAGARLAPVSESEDERDRTERDPMLEASSDQDTDRLSAVSR